MLDGTGNLTGDISVTVIITLCALVTYIRIGFDYKQRWFFIYGMLTAVGFSVWATRLWFAIISGIDVFIAPLSQVGIALMCAGYAATQILALKRIRELAVSQIYCFNDPDKPCHREDRVRAAIVELRHMQEKK